MSPSPFRVLAIGTDVSGVAELESLLGALPADLNLPVAVACERDPEERDALLRRLQAASRLELTEPDDKDDLAAGRIYLAPAGYHLMLDRGTASLDCDDEPRAPSLEALFESAADSYGPLAAAVLLGEHASATAEGALERVRAAGGFALRASGPGATEQLLEALRGRAGKDDRVRSQ